MPTSSGSESPSVWRARSATTSAERRERTNTSARAPTLSRSTSSSAASTTALRRAEGSSPGSPESGSALPGGVAPLVTGGRRWAAEAMASVPALGGASVPDTCCGDGVTLGAGRLSPSAVACVGWGVSGLGESAGAGPPSPGAGSTQGSRRAGCHRARVRSPAGAASSVTATTSSGSTPMRRAAVRAGSAAVAEAHRTTGCGPRGRRRATSRRRRRSTRATCAPRIPR